MKMILCESCGKNPATVHYKEVKNGVKRELNLCAHCAGKIGQKESLFHEDLFGSFPLFSQTASFPAEQMEKCPLCGATLSSVRKNGVFGCSACYDAFSGKLDLTPFVGNGYRAGRLSEKAKETLPKKEKMKETEPALDQIASLREKLKAALETENYEEAARLRDEIREKEGK